MTNSSVINYLNQFKIKIIARVLWVIVVVVGLLAAPPPTFAVPLTTPDLTGSTWIGWTDLGSSTATGVYAKGGKSQDYQIYSIVFIYDSTNPVTGTSSGFTNGRKILGIGIKNNSGASGSPTIKFDPNSNSYNPDSTGSAGDGKSSFSSNADLGDSVLNTSSGNPTEITIRNSGTQTSSGPPCVDTGGTCYYLASGGNWGGSGQPGFRGINPCSSISHRHP